MVKLYSDVVIDRAHDADGGGKNKFYLVPEEVSHGNFMLFRREFDTVLGVPYAQGPSFAYNRSMIDPTSILYPVEQPDTADIFSLEEVGAAILTFNAAAKQATTKSSYIPFSGEPSTRVRSAVTFFGLFGTHITRPEQFRQKRNEPKAAIRAMG